MLPIAIGRIRLLLTRGTGGADGGTRGPGGIFPCALWLLLLFPSDHMHRQSMGYVQTKMSKDGKG